MKFILDCERQAVLENDVSGWSDPLHIIHNAYVYYICPDMEVYILHNYIVNLIFAILEIRRWKTFLKSKLLFFRYIKNDQNIIMLNLCSSLILSYIIFLSAVERTENEVHVHEYTKSSMLNISIVNTTAYLTNTFNLLTNWFN